MRNRMLMSFAGYLAALTKRIKIGTAVVTVAGIHNVSRSLWGGCI